MPAQKQKPQLRYRRTKHNVEIDGDPADVKELALAERYERIVKWCIWLVLLLLLKARIASPIWNSLEEVIRRFSLSAFVKYCLNISG